jgi:hypothetical protein
VLSFVLSFLVSVSFLLLSCCHGFVCAFVRALVFDPLTQVLSAYYDGVASTGFTNTFPYLNIPRRSCIAGNDHLFKRGAIGRMAALRMYNYNLLVTSHAHHHT